MDDVLQNLSATVEKEIRTLGSSEVDDESATRALHILTAEYWPRALHLLSELMASKSAPGPEWMHELAGGNSALIG
jgi:hypothetical protein